MVTTADAAAEKVRYEAIAAQGCTDKELGAPGMAVAIPGEWLDKGL
jgi:hypothetical protein